jgi:uncharacterized membrane protein
MSAALSACRCSKFFLASGGATAARRVGRGMERATSCHVYIARVTAGTEGGHCMSSIETSIEVDVPVRTAYNQWTQFEEFPRFMEGVREVQQLDDRRLRWRAEIGGKEKVWEAEIAEQIPDERVAWHSTSGATNAGVVTFHYLAPEKCRIMLQMKYDPQGFVENVGDALGAAKARIKGDLERFKQFIESQGRESGAWRGEVRQAHHQ